MEKYIEAEKLIAEIERWRDKEKEDYNESIYSMGRCDALAEFRNHIVSLQQDQPEKSIAKEAIQLVFEEKLTPFKDGNQWSFLLGPNIQEGVCGFGDTILDAAIDFYNDYSTTRIHIGELKKTMEQPEGGCSEKPNNLLSEQPEVDLEEYLSAKLFFLGADLIRHKPYSFNRGLNVGMTKAYDDILKKINVKKEK